jgi:hypothetical protein
MSGGGEGDRALLGALPAGGDRRPATKVTAASAALFDLTGDRIATVMVVVDDKVPQVIMFEGDPFVFARLSGSQLFYQQVTPFRALGVQRI